MPKRQLTAEEARAYTDLAEAARRLRVAQARAARRSKQHPKQSAQAVERAREGCRS